MPPAKIEVSQNYPNPFNPITTITYSLPEASIITIRIYDILGKHIKTLVAGYLLNGEHKVHWDASQH